MFIHLRTHSAYSLAEGMLPIKKLVASAVALKQPAIAITDSFNSYGALEFAEAAKAAGIQPIIGAQLVLNDMRKNDATGEVVLLAQNETGWRNLCHIMSQALLRESRDPAIHLPDLAGKSDGLILLTGGAKRGFIAAPFAEARPQVAEDRLAQLLPMFDRRLYIELQRHNMPEEKEAEAALIDLAYEKGLPLVATNDCYFAEKSDATAHSVLLCISDGTTLDNPDRRQESDEHYLKTSDAMLELFADIPEATANTVAIAKRCAYAPPCRSPMLPAFPVPKDESGKAQDEAHYLNTLARDGLAQRLKTHGTAADEAEYQKRLDYELEMISQMGFAGYFLIVADFINWARSNDIPVGPGRGSGAGSLVSYALGITALDPIRWGLLFERFLNPQRVSMPDFDIDFCQNRRDEVLHYVQEKYGRDRVAQIITFGSLHARAALRDVGRVLGISYGQVDRIAKLIPHNPVNPVKLADALRDDSELQAMSKNDEQIADLLKISIQIEGLLRHSSTHAAGVVIGDRPLLELVPLTRDYRSEVLATQFNMKSAEDAGLVKFDFLGLKTLTVQQEALRLLKARGVEIDMDTIPLDDAESFAMLGDGDTIGLFQLESDGMRDVLRRLKPDRFEDIIAVVALYRPGPMDNIPHYIARKHKREQPKSRHPLLDEVLAETYGIMIYQEQVQLAAQVLAGYSLGDADILRRAMGKKDAKVMAAQRSQFIAGAAKNHIAQGLAGRIFDEISAFAGYGFNKSHAAAYALIAWQTTWLKCHYPAEFMAALMTFDMGNTDKIAVFRQDCLEHGIKVLPPSVNDSAAVFTAVTDEDGKPAIRYGLGAIRNVGKEAMADLVAEREANGAFASLSDFATRLAPLLNKKMLENLVKSGAMDGLDWTRASLMGGLEYLASVAQTTRHEMDTAQDRLFGEGDGEAMAIPIKKLAEFPLQEKLGYEMESLGLYLSAHPFDAYSQDLQQRGVPITPANKVEAKVMQSAGARTPLECAGIVVGKRTQLASNGSRFAFLQVSDSSGVIEVVVFAELFGEVGHLLQAHAPVYLKLEGRLDSGRLRLNANKILALDEILKKADGDQPRDLLIHVTDAAAIKSIAETIKRDGDGKSQLTMRMHVVDQDNTPQEVIMPVPGRYRLSAGFRQYLKSLPGVAIVDDQSVENSAKKPLA